MPEPNTKYNYITKLQKDLSNIPKWSENVLENEYNRIKMLSKCDYFDDLIKNIFKSYFKVLFLIKKKREKLSVPSSTKVIHYSFRNPNLNKILEELSGRSIRDCLTLHTVEAVPPQATVPHTDLYSQITLNILLEDECEGGYLYLGDEKVEGYKEKGDYVIYEGRKIEHSVTPIIKGKRKALIVWYGPVKSLL